MCIAIYSERGNQIPSENILRNCFINNDDGAGYAFNTGEGNVEIRKGFMSCEALIEDLEKTDEKYDLTNKGVLLHFRIATSGKIDKGNCHPFPITDSKKKLLRKVCRSSYACVHNGIIHMCTSASGKEGDVSDTAIFVRDYLSSIAKNKGWFAKNSNIDLVERLIDSKMAILNSRGEIISTTGFTKGYDGNYYSNDSYLYSYSRYGLYDFYGDYYMKPDTLMKLKPGEAYYLFDEDYVEEYSPITHTEYPVFMSETNEMYGYWNDDPLDLNNIHFKDLNFLGEGCIMSAGSYFSGDIEFLPYREDVKVH